LEASKKEFRGMTKEEISKLKAEWLMRWEEMRLLDLDLYCFCVMKGMKISEKEFMEKLG
jgi:hypothetical protein